MQIGYLQPVDETHNDERVATWCLEIVKVDDKCTRCEELLR